MSQPVEKKSSQQLSNTAAPIARDLHDYRDTWRVFRIMAELVEGYQFLSKLKEEVTIMGSARFPEQHEYYEIARAFGKRLAENGFTTITGGGPGIMEAANRGAFEAGGKSIGLNIQLPMEQRINPYVTDSTAFYYFFTRKVMLTSPANAFVYFPGGFGTLDEFFEVVDLMELGLMSRVPIVLVGSRFWKPLVEFLRQAVVPMSPQLKFDIDSWQIVDSAEEAFEHVKDVKEISNVCSLSVNNFYCDGNVDWKIFRVMAELVEGFDFLSGLHHAVTVLGSKGVPTTHHSYSAAHELGELFAARGLTVVTGAKKGIAEAVNKGAFEAGGVSVGIGMKVGASTDVNPYMNKSILFSVPFTRKLMITAPTKAFVFFPGGFGTFHQLFEILTLIQTKKIKRRPIILYDHDFWSPLHSYIKKVLVHDVATIEDSDDEIYQIVDSPEAVMKIIETVV